MKNIRLVIISFALAVVFLSILGFKLVGNKDKQPQYPAADQIAARFIDKDATLEKTDATPAFRIDANYDAYTDGKYNYFIDTDNHVVRLVEQIETLPSNLARLEDSDLEKIATEVFRKAYGYDLTGEMVIVNHGAMGDSASPVKIDARERVDELETGNKGIIFLHPDGSVSGATFLPGLKPNESASVDKSKMLSEEAAKEIALTAVRDKTKSTLVEIIEAGDPPYAAGIQRHGDSTFWSVEFLAEFADDAAKKQQAFFGVQIDAYTGRILVVHSSIN